MYSEAALFEAPQGALTADAAFRLLARNLGGSWQISALRGRVVMYRERTAYPNAIRHCSGDDVLDA
ncbi:hypothetical protein EES41_15990 [Streptomyces sp. ADI95-16]|uniref:hypothetical protein n=1 Tax=Streptomyces sp. ADI95-16 TaxID=1522758 RepID=UPI000F432DF2|nr:hypothetical protein [Streptomyces sp. ADI95-16]AYV28223.1 hypothetical protein EES41_15990 [Streptomyces sp. ADI95-16]